MEITNGLHAFLWSNPMTNNCNTYLIDAGKKILIDPGHAHLFTNIKEHLKNLGMSPEDLDLVLLTHGHPDHMEGIREFTAKKTHIALHLEEMDFIRTVAASQGWALDPEDFEPDILLREGDLHVGDLGFQVLHTPGHSPGSICFYWPSEKALFSGDVLFELGVGRTDLPGGNGRQLRESLRRLSRLEVDLLLPGHGQIVSGPEKVRTNFEEVERVWLPFL